MMKKLLTPFENKKWLSIVLLVVGIYLLFFHNMWSYDLMDVDETRYVDMSRYMAHTRDFLTLYVNGDYFFEKPPLYFWLETLSFAIFGKVSYVAARFPIACQAFIMCLGLYFVASKVVSKKFGIVAAFISGTGLEFLVLSKVAMIDTLLTTCTVLSVLSGFMTFFCDEKQKKFYWWSFYIFSALGVMAKGIPAFVIPFGVMFFAGIYTKKLKEYFLPQFLLIGFALFFAIVLPWHIVMLIKHNPQFFQEYIMLHHVARFLGSKILDKNEPFYYYFAVVLWG